MEYPSFIDVEVLGRNAESYPAERPVRRAHIRRHWSDDALVGEDFSEADLITNLESKLPGALSC